MKHAYAAFSSVALISAVVVSSCSEPVDCTVRRDCPSDFHPSAGAANGGAAGEAGATGAAGAPAPAAAGDTSAGGSAGAADAEPCDSNADPATTACVIADDFGLFVAPFGDDATGNGSQAMPFATVTSALTAASAGKQRRIYVCAAEYAEPDTLTPPDGSAVFGGFSCDAGVWAYDAPIKALLTVNSPVGAIIDSAKRGVTLEDLRIDADNAPQNDTGASSFGLVVNASKAVVLVRVELHAGKGATGKPGSTPEVQMAAPSTNEQDGRGASCGAADVPPAVALGGVPASSMCGTGGKGGIGYGAFEHSGNAGSPTTDLISMPEPNGGAGVTATSPAGNLAGPGGDGIGGLAGKSGLVAGRIGSFGPGGYVGAAGGDGTNGAPGQGGGGGGASFNAGGGGRICATGAGGGAGGAGGCGRGGGGGGGGGGASVGLFSWKSQVTLDAAMLLTKAGGAGGKGGAALLGSLGSDGGKGGVNGFTFPAGAGGKGGSGGAGGPGAGGTGGPSVGLVYGGTEPTGVSGSVVTPGAGGAPGPGGSAAVPGGTPAPSGQQGLALAEYAVE